MTDPMPRDRTNAFASCPAATGEARPPCPHFPDGAHRCVLDRGHMRGDGRVAERITHDCTCHYSWTCLSGSIADLLDKTIPPKIRVEVAIKESGDVDLLYMLRRPGDVPATDPATGP